jgi:hypothetical protein
VGLGCSQNRAGVSALYVFASAPWFGDSGLIIGDSVSDQYTPSVARILNTTCQVQHAPWVGGGSANDASNGLNNLENCRWLRTATRPDLHVNWDIIMFNFGLHDLVGIPAKGFSVPRPQRSHGTTYFATTLLLRCTFRS